MRLCLFSLALSIAAIVLAQLLATSSLLGILGAFLPFANVTLNAFACEKIHCLSARFVARFLW